MVPAPSESMTAMDTISEVRKRLVLEMKKKHPNQQIISELSLMVKEFNEISIKNQLFAESEEGIIKGHFDDAVPMENCNSKDIS